MSVSVLKRVARVPDEYQEVEYIESTGTQYIDTDYVPNNSSGIYLKAATLTNEDRVFVGARESINTNSRWYVGSSVNASIGYLAPYGAFNVTDQPATRPEISLGEVFEYQLNYKNNRKRICNGVEGEAIGSQTLATITRKAYICGYDRGSSFQGGHSARFYAIQFTEGDTIVRDFIPCYRKSDNVIGMYDLVNSVFYTNSGTGTFLKGGNIAPYTAERQRINVLEMTLPKEYQQVEYIESTGTQYINTNIIPSNVDTVEVKVALTNITDGVNQYFAGTRNLNSTAIGYSLYFTVHNGVNYYALRWTNDSAGVRPSLNEIFTTKTEFKNGSTKFYYNEQLRDSSTYSQSDYDSGNVIFIGAIRNSDGSPSYISYARYYGIKFSKNGVFVRDLIPCYRKSDNVIGMFDLVSGTFFTNSGTGTFAKGDNVALPIKRVRACLLEPVLPSAYQQVEYIESSGTQYIDTQFIPNQDTRVKTKVYITGGNGGYPGPYGANAGSWTNKSYSTAFGASITYDEYNNDVGIGGNYRNQLIEIDKNKNVLYFNGKTMRTHNETTFTPNVSMYVFAINWNGNPSQYMAGNMYYLQVYDNSTLVRDFVPCYRKSDSVVGLYDLVTKTFYTNSGTGTFSKGADATKYNIIRL